MKFAFIGNRKFVLEEMLKLDLNIVEIFVIQNTHLEKNIKNMDIGYTVVSNKIDFLKALDNIEFDILVSNGCPFILPISKMDTTKKYINIHPSYLPDLKGVDPVIGAIYFQKDAGATCHIMSDEIDGGNIISQIKIPYSDDLDVSLLYQLSFIAEKQSFLKALNEKFIPTKVQKNDKNDIYYKRDEKDKIIDLEQDSIKKIVNKIRAFNNKSQGAYFIYNDIVFKVYDIEIVSNNFIKEYSKKFDNLEIMFIYEDCIVFKKKDQVLKFKQVIGEFSILENSMKLI
jgi:methionyl-tRNA formyltransferase